MKIGEKKGKGKGRGKEKYSVLVNEVGDLVEDLGPHLFARFAPK